MEKLPELEPCSLSFGSPKKYMCVMDKLHNGLTHKQAAEVIRRCKAYEGLVEALSEIEAVSCGEKQVADDDSEGMGWIYKRIQALQETEQ